MYSISQILRGFQEPELAKCEMRKKWQKVSATFPHDIGVQGSYWTTNVGDRAIGKIITQQLTNKGLKVRTFSKKVRSSNAPVHILGGGGVIHDFYDIDHLYRRLDFLGESGAIIGVGVPGIKSEQTQEVLRKKLSDVELITVRDDRSRKKLRSFCENRIQTTACPALLYNDPDEQSSGRTGVNFLSTFSHDSSTMAYYFDYDPNIDFEEANKNYIENMKEICQSVNNPIYIPFHINDEKFARKHLNIDIYPYTASVSETLRRISSVERMVTMRYHSLIFAIVCNKPVLVLNYNPKVASLAERVNVPYYRPHEQIPIEFHNISNREQLRESAKQNFTLLDEFLNNKQH